MDLMTIYETNFTIFTGIFITLVVMGTTTLYDRYKSKSGIPLNFTEIKLFSDLNLKIKSFRLLVEKNSSSALRNPGRTFPGKMVKLFLKSNYSFQAFIRSLSKKASSFPSVLLRRNKHKDGKSVSLSENQKTGSRLSGTDKINYLDRVAESKKDELDFDDNFLNQMSITGTLKSKDPGDEATDPLISEIPSEIDSSSDDNLIFDGSEFEIKTEGLDNEPAEDDFSFNGDNAPEVKFGEESDSLLASLKNDIVVSNEKKINFMDEMQGEDLDLKLMKSNLEDILGELQKYRQYSHHN